MSFEKDICQITLWLRETQRAEALRLWVLKHEFHMEKRIATCACYRLDITRSLSLLAEEVFLPLGYEIQDTGDDIYAADPCNQMHSKHDSILAYARIEAAFAKTSITSRTCPQIASSIADLPDLMRQPYCVYIGRLLREFNDMSSRSDRVVFENF